MLDRVLSDGAAVYTPGVSQRRGGATVYDLHDQLGSAVKQTNSSASTTATRTYDAFGMMLASTGTPQGPFGFAGSSGYQEDGDTGLKLLGHRYYDPSTGRFLTRDAAKHGRNWYAYCANRPAVCIDADGLRAVFIQAGISALITPASGSLSVSISVDLDSGHVGLGVTGGLGAGAGESFGPSVGGGYDGGTSVSTGASTSTAVGMTILAGNGETIIDDNGHATGGAGNVGSPGIGSYVEKRKTLMWDLSAAIYDAWDTVKGWFSR